MKFDTIIKKLTPKRHEVSPFFFTFICGLIFGFLTFNIIRGIIMLVISTIIFELIVFRIYETKEYCIKYRFVFNFFGIMGWILGVVFGFTLWENFKLYCCTLIKSLYKK